jgi:hypothetical protein
LNGEGAAVPRYALYYAPRPSDGLAVTASQWLGRDPETGQTRALRPVPGIAMDRLVEITAEPRLYGFHGTLKAPIALADDASERDFLDAVGRFAANDRTFAIPALELAEISVSSPLCRRRAAPNFTTWPTAVSWSSTNSASLQARPSWRAGGPPA